MEDLRNLVKSVRDKSFPYEKRDQAERNWHLYDQAQVNEIADVLESIPHRKLLRGVLILRNEDAAKVLNFLEQYSLTLHVREVKLTSDDEKILRGIHE